MISKSVIEANLKNTITETNIPFLEKTYSGKVRDIYSYNGKRIAITTDRQSAFDRILAAIPFKGQVLNQTAAFWFDKTLESKTEMTDEMNYNLPVFYSCKTAGAQQIFTEIIVVEGNKERKKKSAKKYLSCT